MGTCNFKCYILLQIIILPNVLRLKFCCLLFLNSWIYDFQLRNDLPNVFLLSWTVDITGFIRLLDCQFVMFDLNTLKSLTASVCNFRPCSKHSHYRCCARAVMPAYVPVMILWEQFEFYHECMNTLSHNMNTGARCVGCYVLSTLRFSSVHVQLSSTLSFWGMALVFIWFSCRFLVKK